MRNFLLLFSAVALLACVEYTGPNRERCLMPGDTIAYQSVTLNGIAIHCEWTVATEITCPGGRVTRYGRADCMEGEKWPRR